MKTFENKVKEETIEVESAKVWTNSFCSSCTVQEALDRNMYNQEEHPKQCTNIHKERKGLVHL